MRLTLRTLLAYLDDTLPSEETKLIGQKVAESPVAQELIERIKKITRRRSLANPPVHGDTSRLDPNTVAEYLDGVLAEEDLAQTEQVCLDDDVYLAEVAACHQILTLMLSEPARVPPPARQRIYQLVKGRESIPNRKAPAYFPNGSRGREVVVERSHHRLNRGPIAAALIALLAVLLVVAVILAWPKGVSSQLAHRGDSSNNSRPVIAGPQDQGSNDKSNDIAKNPVAEKPADSKSTEPRKSNEAKKPAESGKPADSAKSDASSPTPDKANAPKEGSAAKSGSEATSPSKSAEKPAVKPAEKPAVKPVESAPAPAKKPLDLIPLDEPVEDIKDVGRLISVDSVLAARSGQEMQAWRLVRPSGRVTSGVPLVCLAGNRDELLLDSGIQVSLLAFEFLETLVTLNVPAAKVNADVTLDHGRVIFTNIQKDAPARVRLRFRSEIWDLTLAPQSQAFVDGISIFELGDRFSKQPGVESPKTELFVSVPRGSVSVQIRDREPIELTAPPGPGIVGWDNRGRLRAPAPLRAPIPQWSTDQQIQSSWKEDYKAVVAGFLRRVSQPDASIELALKELAESPRKEAQAYAALALASLDVVGPDVDALDDLLKQDMREPAFYALRNWIARRPENSLALHQLLQQKKNYSEPQADAVLQLLHSFSEADALNPETYNHLFGWLKSEKLAIREMAFWHLEKLDPDGVKIAAYNPVLADGRDAAISRWRKRLTDGKIIPKQPTKPAGPAEPKAKGT